MIRALFAAVLFGILGLLFGWVAYAQLLGQQLPFEALPALIFNQPSGLLSSFAYNLIGLSEIRQKLLVCSAVGAIVGALIGALTNSRQVNTVYINQIEIEDESEEEEDKPEKFEGQSKAIKRIVEPHVTRTKRRTPKRRAPISSQLSNRFILVAVAVGVLLVILLMRSQHQRTYVAPTANYSAAFTAPAAPAPTATPYWKHAERKVINDVITLSPGQIFGQRFEVKQGWNKATLTGTFDASGGSGNDVYVCVVDQENYFNFLNKQAFRLLYGSGQVTSANLQVPLREGVYYVAFSNRISIFSRKTVSANLKLEFEYLFYPDWQKR